MTGLHKYASNGNYHKCKCLLDLEENPNLNDDFGNTPLHYATMFGHRECIQLLLDFHADPNLKDYYGWTPLHEAVVSKDVDLITLLLERGCDPLIEDNSGRLAKDLTKNNEILTVLDEYEPVQIKGALD